MNSEEIKKEILAKLPAEIVEKIKSETITEEEMKEYILPLAEQYKEQLEGFAPLSEDQLEAVSGGGLFDGGLLMWIMNLLSKGNDFSNLSANANVDGNNGVPESVEAGARTRRPVCSR